MSSFGQKMALPSAVDETVTGFGGMAGPNDLSSTTSKVNDTKMSDNEAFMAYMNKADAGEDDDE